MDYSIHDYVVYTVVTYIYLSPIHWPLFRAAYNYWRQGCRTARAEWSTGTHPNLLRIFKNMQHYMIDNGTVSLWHGSTTYRLSYVSLKQTIGKNTYLSNAWLFRILMIKAVYSPEVNLSGSVVDSQWFDTGVTSHSATMSERGLVEIQGAPNRGKKGTIWFFPIRDQKLRPILIVVLC